MTETLPALPLPEARLGPHMQALNERQRNFVSACLEMGTLNHARAAAMAGYAGNSNTLAVCGHRLAHNSLVIAAIQEEAERRLKSSAIMAVNVMVDIAKNETHSPKDRLKAAEMIANRVGLHARSEHKVITEDASTTDAAIDARIEELCRGLGIDARTLLGQRAAALVAPKATQTIIDGECEVVQPARDGTEGLEDIL